MANAIEDILNLALDRIKFPGPRISYIYDGSWASRVGLRIYGQTRDATLRASDWDFARGSSALILQKTAPVGGYGWAGTWSNAYPPVPWKYQYAYPAGCLEIRSVRPSPTLILAYDPVPNIFVLGNDPSLAPGPTKVVLTNLAGALAVFTAQVTDPTQWNASFTEALIAALATRYQAAMSGDPNMEKERVQQEVQETAIALDRPG